MPTPATPEITAAAAAELLAGNPAALLLDVREQWEWDDGHAPQAVHLPMGELSERGSGLPRDVPIICVCHLGGRSAAVAATLNRSGWSASNLTGGMRAWQLAGLQDLNSAGEPGTVD